MLPLEQIPSYLSSRKAFSAASEQAEPQGPGSNGKPPESGSSLLTVIVGSFAVGGAVLAVYRTGVLDEYLGKEPYNTLQSAKVGASNQDEQDLPEGGKILEGDEHLVEPIADSRSQETSISTPNGKHVKENIVAELDPSVEEDLSRRQEERQFQVKDEQELKPEDINPVRGEPLPTSLGNTTQSDDSSTSVSESSEESFDVKSPEVRLDTEQQKAVPLTAPVTQDNTSAARNETSSVPMPQVTYQDSPKVHVDHGTKD